MTTDAREAPHHRNLTCYTDYRCRRPACVERKRQYQRDLRAKKKNGHIVFVDAEPVRQHIRTLQQAGASISSIAAAADVDEWNIRALFPSPRRPKRHSLSPDIARKILTVTEDQTTPGRVDGTGTRRRIQALIANGWTLHQLAKRTGISPRHIGDLTRSTQGNRLVYATTANKVAAAYDTLKNKRPYRNGVTGQHSRQARERAQANRWPTTGYWDEFPDAIDDPHFEPMYGLTRGELLAADARELFAYGVRTDQAAQRLGVSLKYLHQVLSRYPEQTELAA